MMNFGPNIVLYHLSVESIKAELIETTRMAVSRG